MAHLIARGIEKSYGNRHVLRGADLNLHTGDRIGLVGVNGSGKSTLLRVLSGEIDSDAGRIELKGTLAVLEQAPQLPGPTVKEAIEGAVAWHGDLLRAYERALAAEDLTLTASLQDQLDHHGWEVGHKVEAVLQRLKAPPMGTPIAHLSGGELRRVALARALLKDTEILLLDEPTNHLDADTVTWLESYLTGYRGALLLITHDRYLLEAVAEKIIEVEGGKSVQYEGSYSDYLVQRVQRQARLEQRRSRHLRMMASEAAWAARSPSARSTKQKARLQRLDSLKETVPELYDRSYAFDLHTGVPKGSTLLEGHGLCRRVEGRVLFKDLNLVLRPGDRVGIYGPNGAGKSMLLRVLRGLDAPDEGQLLKGPRAKIGVLDQDRTGLVDTDTVFEAAGAGNDQVKVGDHWVHVAGFLERFAFSRETFDQPVSVLSGGERARLLLARLMLQGASLLMLDEPTNDLDLLTLRVLEEALLAFDGATVIVTHDRAFLDRVCTSVLAYEGEGQVTTYASRLQAERAAAERKASAKRATPKPSRAAPKPTLRLSYAEKRELEALPGKIEALEAEQEALDAALADPATYRARGAEVPALRARAAALLSEVEALYARWEALGG